jgi:hypothetical protein
MRAPLIIRNTRSLPIQNVGPIALLIGIKTIELSFVNRNNQRIKVLEIVLTDELLSPRVELLDGPRVRLTMSASESLTHSIEFCRNDLAQAVESALSQLHEAESAPARVFVRDASGSQVITTIDPCATYGSQAIVRP